MRSPSATSVEPTHSLRATYARVEAEPPQEYVIGMYYLTNSFSREAIAKARSWFEMCIQKHRIAPEGYVGLAYGLWASIALGTSSPKEAFPRIKEVVTRLLQISPENAEVQTLLGLLAYLHEWRWSAAEQHFLKALEIDPRSGNALVWYSMLLSSMSRHGEAIEKAEAAKKTNPVSLVLRANLAARYFMAREYDRAEEECRWLIDLSDEFWLGYELVGCLRMQGGRFQEAEEALTRAERTGNAKEPLYYRALLYARTERVAAAKEILKALAQMNSRASAFLMSIVHYEVGEVTKSNKFLDVAFLQHDMFLPWEGHSPLFDEYRKEQALESALRRVSQG